MMLCIEAAAGDKDAPLVFFFVYCVFEAAEGPREGAWQSRVARFHIPNCRVKGSHPGRRQEIQRNRELRVEVNKMWRNRRKLMEDHRWSRERRRARQGRQAGL